MRIFPNFQEALDEVKRDLKEMGIRVTTQTMQDKHIADDPDYETIELQNYAYVVTQPDIGDLYPSQPWADEEFEERISGKPSNPGHARLLRPDVWEEFLESSGRFSYTYAERMGSRTMGEWTSETTQLQQLLENLRRYPDNRNHLLSIWDTDDLWRVGEHRVPCSITYHFLYREGRLLMTYNQRSADFITHLVNDIYLATRLQEHVAKQLGWPVGRFTHFVGSLHAYQKDLKGVF